jgi:hypothetical protein
MMNRSTLDLACAEYFNAPSCRSRAGLCEVLHGQEAMNPARQRAELLTHGVGSVHRIQLHLQVPSHVFPRRPFRGLKRQSDHEEPVIKLRCTARSNGRRLQCVGYSEERSALWENPIPYLGLGTVAKPPALLIYPHAMYSCPITTFRPKRESREHPVHGHFALGCAQAPTTEGPCISEG